MVSTIKYDNLPRPSARSFRQRPVIFIMFIIGILACIATALKAMFPFMALYLVGGALRHAFIFLRDRNDDDDSVEESDPDPLSI
jgi:CDP-diacylglycerol--serine O-phosphatidyltransferase